MGLFMRVNYTKYLDRAAKSVRYHAFRSREVKAERLGIFGRTQDHADVAGFIASLDDPLTRDKETKRGTFRPAKMHRVLFSLSRAEFEKCGLTSWKPIIREVLREFERSQGIQLTWVAAEHQSRDHPHVHVDIKSVYQDASGRSHRLKFTRAMSRDLRRIAQRILQREREKHWRQVQEERAYERMRQQTLEHITRTVLEEIRHATREQERDPWQEFIRRRRRTRDDRSR